MPILSEEIFSAAELFKWGTIGSFDNVNWQYVFGTRVPIAHGIGGRLGQENAFEVIILFNY